MRDAPIHKPLPDHLFLRYDTNAEMRWSALADQGELVPSDRFFVRSHGATPTIDPEAWRLRIGGDAVARRLELTLEELAAMPQSDLVCALECAGNGRRLFTERFHRAIDGTPWRLGGIGVAAWRGVRLAHLLELAGIDGGAVDVLAAGLDEPRVRRPLPAATALRPDTLVALSMNGEPLPTDHGFPARLVVPGWAAVASIKWLGHITVSTTPLPSWWSTARYVLSGPRWQGAPGEPGPMVTHQVIKAALELDWPATLPPGPTLLRGRAWSPDGRIAKVDASVTPAGAAGPGTWEPAALAGANLPRAWARFELPFQRRPGRWLVWLRATDEHGSTQPEGVPWNDHGYLYGAIAAHPVTVR
jgi:DMSO/TMAO reductase YedYZ molybdopterin-dependent catalytic subunit